MNDISWVSDGLALAERLYDALLTAARLPLLVLLAGLVAWAALRAVVMGATRPRPVRAGSPTPDLPGDEPPAVVNLLASGWTVTEDGAGATLLDLAARGHLEFRQPDADPRHTTVHVTAGEAGGSVDAELTAYEQQVLDHVRHVAAGGVVPLTALTFRDQDDARRWSRRFASSVIADARRRGLVRPRVPVWAGALLAAVAAVPGLATSWLAWELDHRSDGRALLVGFVPFALLAEVGGRRMGWRGTAAGRAAASRWLGLRAYLEVDRAFADLPPSAVSVWDRYLAYGDAVGVTRISSAVLDLGTGNRERVWSAYGGQWHQVQVRYPRPAARYGAQAPGPAFAGVLTVAIGYGLVRLYQTVMPSAEALGDRANWVIALPVAGLLLGLRGLYRAVRAIADVVTARTIRGEVLWVAPWIKRRRRKDDTAVSVHYLAVDDGSSDRTTAWALPSGVTRGFGPGDVVELTVRPWTRRVTALTAVMSRHAVTAGPVATRADPGFPPVSSAELGARLGLQLEDPRRRPAGPSSAWVYPIAGMPGAEVLVSTASGPTMQRMVEAFRSGEALLGLGDEAWLSPDGAVARLGDRVVLIVVPPGHPLPSDAYVAALAAVLGRVRR